VALQGVGNVGYHLCRLLHEAGATLTVADIDQTKVKRVCNEFAASAVALDDILFCDVDLLAPCALGAILTVDTIPRLQAAIVAGAANNQLQTPEDGRRLADAGILYAPDYVINGGGIINVACEYSGDVDDAGVMDLVARIGPRLTDIFEKSAATGRLTNDIADEQARRIIEAGR